MLGCERLDGKTFLDIGCGSGLFSLAARRLGASVTSFDFDPDSVSCAQKLKAEFCAEDGRWSIRRGSVLDRAFMAGFPRQDVVYSWGVLHHTGDMHEALRLAQDRVSPGGLFFIALYRRTWLCPLWRLEKRLYVASPRSVQSAMRKAFGATVGMAYRLKHGNRALRRGMDDETDVHDWLGGYPYESITPRDLKLVVGSRGFELVRQVIKSEGVHITYGCDEYVFRRTR
jgi:2-polyprenyl-6-hydroxyphenyl methylase/3-demethylubiquinone-9 3-methyltransferase